MDANKLSIKFLLHLFFTQLLITKVCCSIVFLSALIPSETKPI